MAVRKAHLDRERRAFLRRGLRRFFYVLGGVILGYPALSFMTFGKPRRRAVVFHPDEQALSVAFKQGVYLVNTGKGHQALSGRCTHLGCTLNYDPVSQRFRCPCHGSVFDLTGKWLSGPAKRDLSHVPLSVSGNKDLVANLSL
jgi:cytochrome b6-f complex iron-sulfur subunit